MVEGVGSPRATMPAAKQPRRRARGLSWAEEEVKALEAFGAVMEEQPERALELARAWLRVRDREGRTRALEANAAQRAFEARRGRQNIVLKARQMGMTTWVAGRFFLRTITRPGTLTLQVAHTKEAAEAIFRSVQRMWENLPAALREGPLVRSRANAGQMVFQRLDSEFRVGSACDRSVGRGLSVQNLHCSEVSRWPGDATETLAGLRAALAPDGELVLESTPNGAYGAFYEEWSQGRDEGSQGRDEWSHGTAEGSEDGRLVRHFLPWWMEPAYVGAAVGPEAMTDEERALVARHGLSEQQIGFRRGLEASYGALRSQEFAEDAESCFRATGTCCFDVPAVDGRLAELAGVSNLPVERRMSGALLVWLRPVGGREYVVAVDSAGGGEEGDFAAVQVVDRRTGLQCAELQAKLTPAELARAAAELGREYGGALVAVERNNHGAAVIAYLGTQERYSHLYEQDGQAGWLTSSRSKPEIIASLGAMLREVPGCFQSVRLLRECRTFVTGERGRMAAKGGSHDDLVMAMAIAQSVRAERMGLR